jgi:hypothetical protein
MYKEMEKFQKRAEAIEKQIAELQAKQLEVKQELATVTREHDDMIMKEALEGVACDERKLERLKKKIRELEEKISDYENRIAVIESKRSQVLSELVEDLKAGYRREMEALKQEAQAHFNDAVKLGFEYLLALQRVGKVKEKAQVLHEGFLKEIGKATDEFKSEGLHRFTWINTNLFNHSDRFELGVTERAQQQALNGYVSPQVMLYEATGEVEGYYNRAHEKLRKLSK